MTTKWTKYSFVCNSECDALIEYTLQDGYTFNDVTIITCACGDSTTCVSVEDATIRPNLTKEEKMEPYSATVTPAAPIEYNPNLLVTYKKIAGTYAQPEAPEYVTDKVVDLEWTLDQSRRSNDNYNDLKSKVNQLEDLIVELYNPNYSKEEALEQIAELFGFELSKTVTVTGTIEFEVTVQVPLDEIENFDAHYKLGDELSLTAYGDEVEVNTWSIQDTDVDWD
jgi:hydroxymethylpyrimidine pyrophosphatase-like HAD family hydrolase